VEPQPATWAWESQLLMVASVLSGCSVNEVGVDDVCAVAAESFEDLIGDFVPDERFQVVGPDLDPVPYVFRKGLPPPWLTLRCRGNPLSQTQAVLVQRAAARSNSRSAWMIVWSTSEIAPMPVRSKPCWRSHSMTSCASGWPMYSSVNEHST